MSFINDVHTFSEDTVMLHVDEGDGFLENKQGSGNELKRYCLNRIWFTGSLVFGEANEWNHNIYLTFIFYS